MTLNKDEHAKQRDSQKGKDQFHLAVMNSINPIKTETPPLIILDKHEIILTFTTNKS